MQTRRRALLILAALGLLTLISLLLALSLGNVPLGLREALAALFGRGEGMAVEVVRSLRLPRALAGLACGGAIRWLIRMYSAFPAAPASAPCSSCFSA